MVVFSDCKINIGLKIVSKRKDGFHNLETVFFPLPLFDVLELIDADETQITALGLPIPGNQQDNIVLKAYHLLKKDFSKITPVHFYLLKNIPVGAGLGAGSANGAFALSSLNKKFNLGLTENELIQYALQLGSDCPFFIINGPCYAAGRGEILEPLKIDLSAYKIVVVNPGIHISTPWAFAQIKPEAPTLSLKELIQLPVSLWNNSIGNDFEKTVFKAYPPIEKIKNELYKAGAEFALMSGSGSTVFGLFHKNTPPVFDLPKDYFLKCIDLDNND